MKVHVVSYIPPEDDAVILGVIKGRSLAKITALAEKTLAEHDRTQVRLIKESKTEFGVQFRNCYNGIWEEWDDSPDEAITIQPFNMEK